MAAAAFFAPLYTAFVTLADFTSRYSPAIRDTLREQVAKLEQPILRAAAAHLIGRGKLYRPLLALASCQAVSGEVPEELLPAATPLELIHTFTLIHDDLPCMDDADLRRGVPSVHLRYGEAMAVLGGDALLNLAMAELAGAEQIDGLRRIELLRCATRATQQVVEGQVMDLEGEGRHLQMEELDQIHQKKTGSLIGACCETGALLGGADPGLTSALREIGERIGLVFQIRDDLLSVNSTEAVAGKSLSTDVEKLKATYPRIVGIEESRRQLESLLAGVEESINLLPLSDGDLLIDFARRAGERDS